MPKDVLSAFGNWALMVVMAHIVNEYIKMPCSSSFFAPTDAPQLFPCIQHVLRYTIEDSSVL